MKRKKHYRYFSSFAFVLFAHSAIYPDSAPLILKHADYNQNTIINRKFISVLRGEVVFDHEESVIRADYARWYRSEGIVQFKNNVQVKHKKQELTCDYMDYYREKEIANIRGNIDFYDHKQRTRITGRRAVYHLDTKNLELTRSPRLYRYDTSAADTMVVISKRMEYNDSTEIATALEEVEIHKGELSSFSETAYYDLKTNIARLRKKPRLYYEVHKLNGDSVDMWFVDEHLRGVAVMGNAHGIHRDEASKDTIITHVMGDSLYMAIRKDGALDSMWVYGNAKSSYFHVRDSSAENVATGKTMLLSFGDQGGAETLEIFGNATSTYYIEDEGGRGRNEASGDRIFVYFDEGRADYLRMTGSVRGIYFAKSAGK